MFIRLFFLLFSVIYSNSYWQDWQLYLSNAKELAKKIHLKRQIAGLFIVSWNLSDKKSDKEVFEALKKGVGGIIIFNGDTKLLIKKLSQLRRRTHRPLFICIDGEWGLAMRLSDGEKVPLNIAMGATQDTSLAYKAGLLIAKDASRFGIHSLLSPVVDIASFNENTVIRNRSFGGNRELVINMARAFIRGLREGGVFPVIKHFPGHGATIEDSHYELARVIVPEDSFFKIHLDPFSKLISEGVSGVMVGHIWVPFIDSAPLPSSASYKVVTKLLRDSLKFNGLVFSDALNMKGVSGFTSYDLFSAGVDAILMPSNIDSAILQTYQMVLKNNDSLLFAEKYIKFLALRLWANSKKNKVPKNLAPQFEKLRHKVFSKSITLLKDDEILPLREKDTICFYTNLAYHKAQQAIKHLSNYFNVIYVQDSLVQNPKNEYKNILQTYDSTLVSSKNATYLFFVKYASSRKEPYWQIDSSIIKKIQNINGKKIVVLLGHPGILNAFPELYLSANVLLTTYEDDTCTYLEIARMLSGEKPIIGSLPVKIEKIQIPPLIKPSSKIIRLPSSPDIERLNKRIDYVLKDGLSKKAYTSAVCLIGVDNKIITLRTYGKAIKDNMWVPTNENTLFDLASITKVVASTAILMILYDKKLIDINDTLGKFLPTQLKETKWSKITLAQILTHTAGTTPWIPFYKKLLANPSSFDELCTKNKNGFSDFTVKVSSSLSCKPIIKDYIYKWILESPISEEKKFTYSDLGFYLIPLIVENVLKMPFEKAFEELIKKPLNMNLTYFNPPIDQMTVAPSEIDTYFRYDTLWGYVHDPGAALLGGISGHAGLFSTAMDLFKFSLAILNKGFAGSKQIFTEETINLFTQTHYEDNKTAWGLGFSKMKPYLPQSFGLSPNDVIGHTGFTGTLLWIDLTNKITIILLTNRTFPSSENNKFINLNIRNKIIDIAYEELKNIEFL